MYFKLVSKNGYRDLVRNARRICVSQLSEEEKSAAFVELYEILKDKLFESTRSLNIEAAYADRCIHWNQREIDQIKPVNNMRNPWLRFKREFEQCLDGRTPSKNVETALAWFYASPYRDDWIAS
jgi:hypothetical protein